MARLPRTNSLRRLEAAGCRWTVPDEWITSSWNNPSSAIAGIRNSTESPPSDLVLDQLDVSDKKRRVASRSSGRVNRGLCFRSGSSASAVQSKCPALTRQRNPDPGDASPIIRRFTVPTGPL